MSPVGFSTPLISLDAVVLDTETTGLDANSARIIQVGAVRVREGAIVDGHVFDSLVNPGVPIPKPTTAVHGIDDTMVHSAPAFPEVAGRIEQFIGNAIIVGHTIGYDLQILRREYAIAGRAWPNLRALDVRALARVARPSLAHHDLDRLCAWLGIENTARHRALGDAEATAKVFIALLPLLRAQGIRTLAEAEAASRDLAERQAGEVSGIGPVSDTSREFGPLARIDTFPYRHRVRDVMSSPAAFAPPDTTVGAAISMLISRRISSVFVKGEDGITGIVTERDLLRAIDAASDGSGLALPISGIARKPLETVSEDAFAYRAIGRIERFGFRHLGVHAKSGEIIGAVTTRNLLRHRASTAIALGDEIDSAGSAAALGIAWSKLTGMARALLSEDVDAFNITAVVSSEIAGMTRRAAQLAEAAMVSDGQGHAPVPFAVLVLGSAGRGESQLAADQDNAIVYASGGEGSTEDRWFEAMARRMCGILDQAGVPFCKGGVMAQNRDWRMSVADWRQRIDGWVRRQRPQDLLNVDIFFDAQPVHGEMQLGEEIWNYAYARAHPAKDFHKALGEVTRERRSPFTLLGGFRTDASGRIDLKKHGLLPIFTAARVLSIQHDVRARATPDRLNGVLEKGVGSRDSISAIIDAQGVLLGAVIAQQLKDSEVGVPPSVRVATAGLNSAGKSRLKAALSAAADAVELIAEGRI